MGNNKIAITLVCNDKFIRLTKVCLYSFFKHNDWFDGDIVILHDDGTECGLSDDSKKELLSLGHPLKFHCVNHFDYAKTFEHFRGHLPKNLNSSFYKLDVFNFDEYDKVIQIDGDMLFLGSIEDIIEHQFDIEMCEDKCLHEVRGEFITSLPNNNKMREDEYCNGGFFILGKNILQQRLRDTLLDYASTFDLTQIAPYTPLPQKWVEQDILNVYFHDNKYSFFLLSNEYNMSKRNFFLEQRLHVVNDVKILHYLADKPFMNTEENTCYVKINEIWLKEEQEMMV